MADGVEHIAGPYTDGLQLFGGGGGRPSYWVVITRFEGAAEPAATPCRSDA